MTYIEFILAKSPFLYGKIAHVCHLKKNNIFAVQITSVGTMTGQPVFCEKNITVVADLGKEEPGFRAKNSETSPVPCSRI